MRRRRYNPEFKQRAIALAKELDNVAEAAKKLGVPKQTLYLWVYGPEDSKPSPVSQELSAEEQVRALRKENEELRKANHILKQAAAFFSQDHLK
jgi:transposase